MFTAAPEIPRGSSPVPVTPIGKVKLSAALKILRTGPFTKDVFVEPGVVAPILNVSKLVRVVLRMPLVNVTAPLIVRAACSVTPLLLFIIKLNGPLAAGNSTLVDVWAEEPLYSRVEAAPKVGEVPNVVAVPCKESVPLTVVAAAIVLAPLFDSVRLK